MSGPEHHRIKQQNERLLGYECQECGWVSFPEQREICKRCGSTTAAFSEVELQERGEVMTFVVQQYLPDEFESPTPLAIVDLPQREGDGEPARVYGLFTETTREDLEVGAEVEARFREIFSDGDRPVNSFKFSTPRGETP